MPPEGVTAEFDPNLLASFDQRIVGRDYGSCPPIDFPRLVDLYRQGTLDLDAMVSSSLSLTDVDAACAALGKGRASAT